MKTVSTVEAKFKRSGIKSQATKLWRETDHSIRDLILEKAHLQLNEEPIINYYRNPLFWWLLTNERLLIFNTDDVVFYNLADITKVELKALFEGNVEKQDCTSVHIYVKDRYIDLDLENGTWPIIYNILRFVT